MKLAILVLSILLIVAGIVLSFVAVDRKKRSTATELASSVFVVGFVILLLKEVVEGDRMAIGGVVALVGGLCLLGFV